MAVAVAKMASWSGVRAVIAALGLWLATEWVDGITIDSPATLLLAGLLLGIVNAFVRPLLVVLTLPFTVLTLGLFLLVVNAAMLGLVAALLDDAIESGVEASTAYADLGWGKLHSWSPVGSVLVKEVWLNVMAPVA